MNEAFENEQDIRVRVIGVGGVGGRLAARIGEMNLQSVDVAAVDTDHSVLTKLGLPWTVPLENAEDKGGGTGKRIDLAVKAAENAGPEIESLVSGGSIAIIIASLGGGTGGGAAPVIAGRLHRAGAVSVLIGIEPFAFEGELRRQAARKAAEFASEVADCAVLVPSHVAGADDEGLAFGETIRSINRQVADCVSSLARVIAVPGAFDLDLGDIGRVLAASGYAAIGFGREKGTGAAANAVRSACSSSLLDVQHLTSAHSVLLHISVGPQTTVDEVEQATALFSRLSAGSDFVLGVTTRENTDDESAAEALVICSGFSAEELPGLPTEDTEFEELPARDPNAFYYDGKNIDIPTFLRRCRSNKAPALTV